MTHGIAPVGLTGGAAEGADLEGVHADRGEGGDFHAAGAGEELRGEPGAGHAADTDEGEADFIGLGSSPGWTFRPGNSA